jgi:hypothetical protein
MSKPKLPYWVHKQLLLIETKATIIIKFVSDKIKCVSKNYLQIL